jgi:hypothetical protein
MTNQETLKTKIAVNEVSFPLVTHMVYSDGQFDSYEILKSGQGAELFLGRLDRWLNDQDLRA